MSSARTPDDEASRLATQRTQQMASELAEQHELFRVTLKSIADAVITTDAQGHVAWMNPVAERMTGWPAAEARGLRLSEVFELVIGPSGQSIDGLNPTVVAEGEGEDLPLCFVSRDGREYGVEHSASPIFSDSGSILGVVTVFRDVTEQRRLAGEMSFRASHDILTGLANRAVLESALKRAWASARADGASHALLSIDLDHFKLVNDVCGHAAGDLLLQQLAAMMRETVRGSDTVARLGGDEFAILLHRCSLADAQKVAQSLCDRVDQFRFVHEGQSFRVGTSIGLVVVDPQSASTAQLLKAADAACYAAKEGGRNRVHLGLGSDAAAQLRGGDQGWVARIEEALRNQGLVLSARPIQSLSGTAVAPDAELLLSLRQADGTLIPAEAFMPAAERFQLATRVDQWVLDAALTWLRSHPAITSLGRLSIRLSMSSLADTGFHRWAGDQLAAAGAPICTHLGLDIAESAVANLADVLSPFVARLRGLGVHVALDDFGMGGRWFSALKSLPVDLLKIDAALISRLIDDPLDAAAVGCIVQTARSLGLQTLAKGVDRAAILARVREMGLDSAHGGALHAARPLEEGVPAALRSADEGQAPTPLVAAAG